MEVVKYTSEWKHIAINFECGNSVIDNFLKSDNALDENYGVTYIMLSDDKDDILGYYNIEADRVDFIETVGTQVLYKPMGGAVSINYLAVNKDYQGMKIMELDDKNIYFGDWLLRDCEKRIVDLRKHIGASFVVLCSTQQGYNLYKRNGYEDFESDMNIVVDENNSSCYKMYKCIDDIV